MKKAIVVAVVLVAFGAVAAWKIVTESQQAEPASQVTAAETGPQVLLFADPDEAAASCGCAEVIRLARTAAGVEGVALVEVDTTRSDPRAEHHRVLVSPTVIVTDSQGREVQRFEGESGETITKLRAAIEALGAAG